MGKDNRLRLIRFSKKVKYKEEFNQYSLQLCHIHRPWWLFLFLLPLLLLIKCNKDIAVNCIEPTGNLPIENLPVTMKYEVHYLWNNKIFLATDSIQRTQNTDSTGKTVFKDLPCSIFSYIFYCLSNASYVAKSDCHATADEKHNFHCTSNIKLKMSPRLEDLHVELLDKETGDVLPDGILIYKYTEQEKEKTDSVHANAAGIAIIPQMRYCSVMKEIKGTCYGYADTLRKDIPCQNLVNANNRTALKLRPLKERFTFFVKNKETKQPIPDVLCYVSLTHPGNSKRIANRQVRTSIDGKGIAVYDNAFVLSTIAITANKTHYKEGKLEGGPWVVENFNEQDNDTRTIWLEPEPYLQEFINIDSLTGRPIAGVKNVMKMTTLGGMTTVTEISNRNGVFPILAKEDAQIEIASTKTPEYKQKISRFSKFKDIKEKDREIRMQPIIETLSFRTVREEMKDVLLPNCKLWVTGSISGVLSPNDSDNGEFTVTMRKYEDLTIVASRKGYTTNSTKVRNRDWNYLQAEQIRRDIPLKLDLPPCSGGINVPKQTNEMEHQRSYGMGQEEGDASISGNFYSEPDFLTVYDGPDTSGKILIGPNQPIANKFSLPFHFTQGAVTVVIKTSTSNGSTWEYVVDCPH